MKTKKGSKIEARAKKVLKMVNEKKKRKNIRKVMQISDLHLLTQVATKRESDRKIRLEESAILVSNTKSLSTTAYFIYDTLSAHVFIFMFQYNQIYDLNSTKLEKLVLDYNTETHQEIISVNANLVKDLKPHQARGIKFMWDACFESIDRLNEDRGGGCILAHCMGLGKYFSVHDIILLMYFTTQVYSH